MLRRVRRVKTPEEVEAIRSSVHIAERALREAESALTPGITERQLTGIFMQAMASAGVTTPSTQDVAWTTSRHHPWRRASRDVPVARGDLVAFDAGVIVGGYVGELGRTHVVGGDTVDLELSERWSELWDRLLTACRPGAPLSDLLAAYDAAGVPAPPMPVARGLGLGFDLPLVTHALPGEAAEPTGRGWHGDGADGVRVEGRRWRPLRRRTGRRDRSWARSPCFGSASHWKEHLT